MDLPTGAECHVTQDQIKLGDRVIQPSLVQAVNVVNKSVTAIVLLFEIGAASLIVDALKPFSVDVPRDGSNPYWFFQLIGVVFIACGLWKLWSPSHTLQLTLHSGDVIELPSRDRKYLEACERAIRQVVFR